MAREQEEIFDEYNLKRIEERRRNTPVLPEESVQGRGVTGGTTGVPVSSTMAQSNQV